MSEDEVWTTKDGREIPVRKMTTQHIQNAKAMMERNGFVSPKTVAFYLFGPKPGGEGAQMAFERECDDIFSREPHPMLDVFEEELRRRAHAGSEGH